jgi:hypothetical protein
MPKIAGDCNLLYLKLDEALGMCLPYFDGKPGGVDRSLLPNLLRYELRLLLEQHGVDARDEEDDEGDWDAPGVQRLANNGLMLHLLGGRVRMRVRMHDQGRLPVPGHSKTLCAFYNQLLIPDDAPVAEIRLVATWSWCHTGLEALTIHCPRSGYAKRESVTEHWRMPVLDPLLGARPSWDFEDDEAVTTDEDDAPRIVPELPVDDDLEHFNEVLPDETLPDETQTGTDEPQ